MRFDKAKLEALAAMPDDQLWAEIVKIADRLYLEQINF